MRSDDAPQPGVERLSYGDVDLNLLLVLERVLHRESVALAAQDLGLSPSATSRALQRLREALADPLLVRSGNRLTPTERAAALLAPASRAVEAARQVFLANRTFDPNRSSGEIVLGLGDELQQALFPALFERLHAEAPGIDVRIRGLSMQSADEGRRDALHLAIAPDLTVIGTIRGLPDVSDMVRQRLYQRRFVVIGAAEAWPEAPDLDAYAAAEHAIMTDEAGDRGFYDDVLANHGRSRRVTCSLTSFAAIASLVRTSRLLALLPAEVLPTFGHGLVAYPPPVPIPAMDMCLMWHPRHTTQPRHRFVRRIVAEVAEEQLGTPP